MSDVVPPKADPPMCPAPIRDMRSPELTLPAKAADCHAHVFGTQDRYPYAATRLYTPPPVYLEDYLAMLRTAGLAAVCWCRPGSTATTTASSSMRSRPTPASCAASR